MESVYYDLERMNEIIAQEGHREIIGGRWDQLGDLQLDFMKKAGLQAHHKLLDVGCGSLRAGLRFVEYLEQGHYYGIDISERLLNAGYEIELEKAGLRGRLARENLICNAEFKISTTDGFFDFAIAQSLFTHLSLPTIRTCLSNVARAIKPRGMLYATILRLPEDAEPSHAFLHEQSGLTSYPSSDPYHQKYSTLRAEAEPFWDCHLIGPWGHPGGNEMVSFVRR